MQHVAGLDPVRPLQGLNSAVYRYGEAGIQGRANNIIILRPAQGPLSAMGVTVGKLSPKGPKGSSYSVSRGQGQPARPEQECSMHGRQ